jgi:hypothetical protein
MKDVGYIMKGMKIAKRLCIITPLIAELLACEENFDPRKEEIVNLYSVHEEVLNTANLIGKDYKKEGEITIYRKKILKGLDTGSDTISIRYSHGGHGSEASFCCSILFLAGFIAFLLMFNIIQLSTTVTILDQLASETLTYTPSANEIIFASN